MTLKAAKAHLGRDARLRKLMTTLDVPELKKEHDLYFSLLRAIVGQQLSVKAAATIWQRFLQLFPEGYPHATAVLAMDPGMMRSAGISFQKAGYIRNIAQFAQDQGMLPSQLNNMNDDELVAHLASIKGVGRWTVQMLLMFSMGREDVFPADDLGIQNGMKALYGLKPASKKELLALMHQKAKRWQPYTSLACMYIWRYKDTLKK